ncbi:histidine phosphotransferase family protein [Azospirillum griseum]|uniref:histidine phosphotransferase family protein n=1 Tax=Azospirillum griseum TaxID=2496639 RepID=UPI001FE3D09D|nr:histidine phosphotransferase family protein [Azospirillum griseum]
MTDVHSVDTLPVAATPAVTDLRVLELLASKLCHDLVSPVGAIRNGLELIEEMREDAEGVGDDGENASCGPPDFLTEAVALIDHSAVQADRRLRVFRLAYGAAGRELRGFSDARLAAMGWLDGGRTALDWPDHSLPPTLAERRGVVKSVLNMILLADEAMPYGGRISVNGDGGATGGRVVVVASGRPGALTPDSDAALRGASANALTPRTVHAYLTGRFAEDAGLRVSATPSGPDRLIIAAVW